MIERFREKCRFKMCHYWIIAEIRYLSNKEICKQRTLLYKEKSEIDIFPPEQSILLSRPLHHLCPPHYRSYTLYHFHISRILLLSMRLNFWMSFPHWHASLCDFLTRLCIVEHVCLQLCECNNTTKVTHSNRMKVGVNEKENCLALFHCDLKSDVFLWYNCWQSQWLTQRIEKHSTSASPIREGRCLIFECLFLKKLFWILYTNTTKSIISCVCSECIRNI